MNENNDVLSHVSVYHDLIIEMLVYDNNINGYLKCKGISDEISADEKANIKVEFEERQKEVNNKRREFLESVNGLSIDDIELIVKELQLICTKRTEIKRQAVKLLTDEAFRNRIFELRKQDFTVIYELIEFISKSFSVDDYPVYTLKPKTVLYGTEVDKSSKGKKYLPPLDNEEIKKSIKVFADKNHEALYEWIMAILAVDTNQIIEVYKGKYTEERQKLLLWVIEVLKTDKQMQCIISSKLFENGDLARLVKLQVSVTSSEIKIKELEDSIETMKVAEEEKDKSYWERAERQKKIIDDNKEELERLRVKVDNYDAMSNRLTNTTERYYAQIKANEILVGECESRKKESEDKINSVLSENQELKSELNDLKSAYENIQSDLGMKVAELNKLSESVDGLEAKGKEKALQELIFKMKDQLYFITQIYGELHDTGVLQKDSVEMFGYTIKNIKDSFESLNVEVIGEIGETVEYDSSMHDSIVERLSNGDKAVIRMPGWKIYGSIYIKAQVEKEN